MLPQHNLFLPRYLRGLIVSRVHKKVLMLMIDKMMTKVKHQVWPNLFLRVIKIWSIFQHVISQSSLHTWLDNMVKNHLLKVLKSLKKTEVYFMRMEVNYNWFRCLAIYNSVTKMHWMASSTSVQPTWLYRTCNADHRRDK